MSHAQIAQHTGPLGFSCATMRIILAKISGGVGLIEIIASYKLYDITQCTMDLRLPPLVTALAAISRNPKFFCGTLGKNLRVILAGMSRL